MSVSSARFHVGPSSDVDAPLMPTAARAKHPAATTPMRAAGSRALPEDVAQTVGGRQPHHPRHAHERGDPAQRFEGFTQRDRRHDGDEDHLGLGVDGSDREVAKVERPQQCDRAEDLDDRRLQR